MINLDIIHAFIEVAQSGSVNRAAQKMRLTQPGVSQKIKALEGILGESLFYRKRSGMELNAAGQEFFEMCRDIESNIDFLNKWILNKQGCITGHIQITTISGFITYIFPKFLKLFYNKYPDVKVSIDVEVSAMVEDKVLKAQSDLGIIIGSCRKSSLKIQKLCENRVYMVCSPDYFLAKKKRITKKDLKQARILMHADKHSRTVKIVAKKLGYSSERDFGDVFLIDMEACKAHALEGVGVAFVANMYLQEEFKSKKLVRLPGFEISRPANLIIRNEKYQTPLVAAFKKELIQYCSKLRF